MTDSSLTRCGLPRRLAAILYDTMLLLAVLFIATALVMPLTGGEAVGANDPFLSTYLIGVAFLFFGGFWTHGGQTLGMRAWRIRLQTREGQAITWRHAGLRFLVAIVSWGVAGLGFLWALFDREGLTWHDRASGTVLVVLPKGGNVKSQE